MWKTQKSSTSEIRASLMADSKAAGILSISLQVANPAFLSLITLIEK